jgi:hypothetical protein
MLGKSWRVEVRLFPTQKFTPYRPLPEWMTNEEQEKKREQQIKTIRQKERHVLEAMACLTPLKLRFLNLAGETISVEVPADVLLEPLGKEAKIYTPRDACYAPPVVKTLEQLRESDCRPKLNIGKTIQN